AAVERSVSFVRFRVERVLAGGDDSSPEGKDRMIDELRPVFAQLSDGAMRMELVRMASGRLGVPDSVFERRLAAAPGRSRAGRASGGRSESREGARAEGGGARAGMLSGREVAERAFLALCIASPEEGSAMLASIDVEEDFSSDLLRRAARHLAGGDLREPMAAAPGEAAWTRIQSSSGCW